MTTISIMKDYSETEHIKTSRIMTGTAAQKLTIQWT